MKWLIYLVIGIVGIFAVVFIMGFVAAAFSSRKKFGNHAAGLFNQLSDNEKIVIRKVWFSFKKAAANEANAAVASLSSSNAKHIEALFDPNQRTSESSAGKINDNAIWHMYINEAKGKGFNEIASIIVAGVGLNGIEKILDVDG